MPWKGGGAMNERCYDKNSILRWVIRKLVNDDVRTYKESLAGGLRLVVPCNPMLPWQLWILCQP
jgi:hypothetical protein